MQETALRRREAGQAASPIARPSWPGGERSRAVSRPLPRWRDTHPPSPCATRFPPGCRNSLRKKWFRQRCQDRSGNAGVDRAAVPDRAASHQAFDRQQDVRAGKTLWVAETCGCRIQRNAGLLAPGRPGRRARRQHIGFGRYSLANRRVTSWCCAILRIHVVARWLPRRPGEGIGPGRAEKNHRIGS